MQPLGVLLLSCENSSAFDVKLVASLRKRWDSLICFRSVFSRLYELDRLSFCIAFYQSGMPDLA